MGMFLEFKKKSGKRDSDPRPQPWQGCALPTELFPLISSFKEHLSRLRMQRYAIFPNYQNFLAFFSKKSINPCDFGNLHSQNGAIFPIFRPCGAFQWMGEKFH